VSEVGGGLRATSDEAMRAAKARYSTAVIVRIAILSSIAVLLLVASLLDIPVESTASAGVLLLPFALFGGVSLLAAVYLVPRVVKMPSNTTPLSGEAAQTDWVTPEKVVGVLFARAIAESAFVEVSAVLGFVLAVLGASMSVYLSFFAVTFVGLGMTFPRWNAWEQEIADAVRPDVLGHG
jgi:hypothetical protein